MAVAGFCDQCRRNVWLNDSWGCENGHGWDQIRDWYDPASGTAVTPYWLRPAASAEPAPEPLETAPEPPAAAPSPAPAVPAAAPVGPASRIELLAEILATFAKYPGYRVQYGTDTDITIDNDISDASWAGGRMKVEYAAVLKAVEPEATVYFWEILKEQKAGLSFGQLDSESYTTLGARRSGETREVVVGPGGVVADAAWDYGATRSIVESVTASRGWRLTTVIRKAAAQWT